MKLYREEELGDDIKKVDILTVTELGAIQIGWFNPDSGRFCYTDEKEAWPEPKRRFTKPVYALLEEGK